MKVKKSLHRKGSDQIDLQQMSGLLPGAAHGGGIMEVLRLLKKSKTVNKEHKTVHPEPVRPKCQD